MSLVLLVFAVLRCSLALLGQRKTTHPQTTRMPPADSFPPNTKDSSSPLSVVELGDTKGLKRNEERAWFLIEERTFY